MNSYFTTHTDRCIVHFILDDNFRILENLLNFFDAGFDVPLLIFRCIVLCIFRQVSLLSRLLDLAGYFFYALPLSDHEARPLTFSTPHMSICFSFLPFSCTLSLPS